MNKTKHHLCGLIALFAIAITPALSFANTKPNILVIMSDDVGITNLSAYSRGMAGYHTPDMY